MNLLAGDIGGTKTNLAIFASQTGPRTPLAQATFPSTDYPNLETLVGEFLSQIDLPVERASFGVAGPVVAGQATITNLPWVIDEQRLQDALKLAPVRLLNDLQAIANGVPFLEPPDLHTLNEGQPAAGGAIAVVAPGTGLGEAFLSWDGARYRPHPSEGGHADFAPNTPLEVDLLRYLLDRFAGDRQHCPRRRTAVRALRHHAGHLRLHPGGGGGEPGARRTGDRRRLPGRWHPAPHPARPGGGTVHAIVHAQGTHVEAAGGGAGARHPQPRSRAPGRGLPRTRTVEDGDTDGIPTPQFLAHILNQLRRKNDVRRSMDSHRRRGGRP
jgi:hypothetical protein